MIFEGFRATVLLAAVAFAVSLLPALIIAIIRVYGRPWIRAPLFLVVALARGIPAVVLIVFIFFGLPYIGITFTSFVTVVLTLALVQTVYFSEVFRGALLSVGKGQFEAAYSCGLRTGQTYRYVIVPQAFSVAAPAFASSVIQLVQNTTVASVTTMRDVVGVSLDIQASTGSPAPWVPTTVLFLLLLLPLVRIVRKREARMARSKLGRGSRE